MHLLAGDALKVHMTPPSHPIPSHVSAPVEGLCLGHVCDEM